jgi:hypothetical protein
MEEIQPRMWEEGEAFRRVKRLPMPVPASLLGQYQAASSAAASSGSSSARGGTGSTQASPTATGTGAVRGGSGAGAMPASPTRLVLAVLFPIAVVLDRFLLLFQS